LPENDIARDVFSQPIDVSYKLIPLVSGSEYATLGFDSEQYGPPRMFGFRMRYSFGKDMH
jgi:hypothetical protein